MPIDTYSLLSRLEPLAAYLAKSTDIDSGLVDVLEENLPKKGQEKLIQQVDKLLQEPQGARVLVLTVRYLLDEWLREGDDKLSRISKELDPYAWLATSDHLEVVQTFRELL